MHETFEHTADIGLRVRAASIEQLMAEAAEALMAVIVFNPAEIRPRESQRFTIPGDRDDDLLHDWLAQLVFTFDTRHLVFSRFEVQRQPDGLAAQAWGERLDPERHELGMEVKAVTYHELKVEPTADGWLAEVILDL
jgi:SHS2 domain-containing protein